MFTEVNLLCEVTGCLVNLCISPQLFSEIKKDPGIPNLFPLKEQLLKQMEDRKQRAEDMRAHQKAKRHLEHAKRRSLQGLQNDAQKRTIDFEKKVVYLSWSPVINQLLHMSVKMYL